MLSESSEKWRGRFLAFAPLFLWVGVIFFLSSDHGSMAETSRFIRPLLQCLFPSANEATLQIYHGYIRKAAHFTEYAVLALFVFRAAASVTGGVILRFIIPLTVVISVACIDEFNQSFEPSRTSSARDILLDIAGGVVMLVCIWLVSRRRSAARSAT